MNGNPWRAADIALLRYHARRGAKVALIAKMLGRSLTAVYDKASQLDIRLNRRGPAPKFGDDVALEAVRRYFEGGETQQAIASDLGISRGNVQKWCNGTERPHLREKFVPRASGVR